MKHPLVTPVLVTAAWHRLQDQVTRNGPTPCAGPDRDDWTGSNSQQARAADRCLDCPVLEACSAYAEIAAERSSTWGGYSAAQRAARGRTDR